MARSISAVSASSIPSAIVVMPWLRASMMMLRTMANTRGFWRILEIIQRESEAEIQQRLQVVHQVVEITDQLAFRNFEHERF